MKSAENYSAAIDTDAQRVALNGLTSQCIAAARAKKERLRFSSKGVDALGTAKRFLENKERFGSRDPRTLSADRVFEADIGTGLFEETEDVFSFLVSYPVDNGEIIMGDMVWDELTARGALDERTEEWYWHRAFAETREAVLAGDMLRSGELAKNDIITISNTSTAKSASDYFSGQDLMIRRVHFNERTNMIEMDQIMMKHLSNEVVEQLFSVLNVKVDDRTFHNSDDESVKYLATQIKVKRGELQNGAADIAFMLDCIMTERTGRPYIFGQEVDGVTGNPYARIAEVSRDKERRRQAAIDFLKKEFINFARRGQASKDELREAYEAARSMVADIEGKEFVRERYGSKAAEAFEKKQQAIASGDIDGAIAAETSMQSNMGSVSICNTVFEQSSSKDSGVSALDTFICTRLPRPGEVARCPCCYERVVVAGTEDKIACSKAGCKLEDPRLRKKRLSEKQAQKRPSPKKPTKEFKFFDFSHLKKDPKKLKRETMAA